MMLVLWVVSCEVLGAASSSREIRFKSCRVGRTARFDDAI